MLLQINDSSSAALHDQHVKCQMLEQLFEVSKKVNQNITKNETSSGKNAKHLTTNYRLRTPD
jgi:hypothetical protein